MIIKWKIVFDDGKQDPEELREMLFSLYNVRIIEEMKE